MRDHRLPQSHVKKFVRIYIDQIKANHISHVWLEVQQIGFHLRLHQTCAEVRLFQTSPLKGLKTSIAILLNDDEELGGSERPLQSTLVTSPEAAMYDQDEIAAALLQLPDVLSLAVSNSMLYSPSFQLESHFEQLCFPASEIWT